jgi:hypothetical protein
MHLQSSRRHCSTDSDGAVEERTAVTIDMKFAHVRRRALEEVITGAPIFPVRTNDRRTTRIRGEETGREARGTNNVQRIRRGRRADTDVSCAGNREPLRRSHEKPGRDRIRRRDVEHQLETAAISESHGRRVNIELIGRDGRADADETGVRIVDVTAGILLRPLCRHGEPCHQSAERQNETDQGLGCAQRHRVDLSCGRLAPEAVPCVHVPHKP